MGTNFYLFTKNKEMALKYAPYSYELTDDPEFGYEVHIAKTSCGWLPLFQAHKEGIHSVREYREAYDTGEFKILDEYNDEYTWEAFDERVLQFNGGRLGVEKPKKVKPLTKKQKELFGNYQDKCMPKYTPVSHIPGTGQSYIYVNYFGENENTIFTDAEGYEFESIEFS